MKYRKKPVVIDAITFDELVQYGRDSGGNIVNGMPWSFQYVVQYLDKDGTPHARSHPITHENDDCYLVATLEGTMRFDRGDMLITGVKGEMYPCKPDIFAATYDAVESP